MNTGNTTLDICGEQVGLTGTDMLNTNVDTFVFAQDFYYGRPGDLVTGNRGGATPNTEAMLFTTH